MKLLMVSQYFIGVFLAIGFGHQSNFKPLQTTSQQMLADICFNPMDYGAVPNDLGNDQFAFQAAVNAAASQAIVTNRNVCIPTGNWRIERAVVGIPSIKIAGVTGLNMYGVGPNTRLMMTGDGKLSDWRLIDIRENSSNISVHDMTLDGTQRFNTEEQTHVLHINGPVNGVTVERVNFDSPQIGVQKGGDCVRLLGGVNSEVQNVVLRSLLGANCDRSFIGLQRGVRGLLIDAVTSVHVGDQALDFEPTGGVEIADVTIQNSTFSRGANAQGGITVAIGGDGAATAKRITMTNIVINDGGLRIIDAEQVLIFGVIVHGVFNSIEPVLHILKRAVGIKITQSNFIRPVDAIPGLLVSIHHQSGVAPSDVVFNNVIFEQNTISAMVKIESLNTLTIKDSKFIYTGNSNNIVAIFGRGVITSNAYTKLLDNTVHGFIKGLLSLSQYSALYPIGKIIVTETVAPNLTTYGVNLNHALPTTPPVLLNNNFGFAIPLMP